MSVGNLLAVAASTGQTVATKTASASTGKAFNWANMDWEGYLVSWTSAIVIALVGMWLAKRLSIALERALTRARVESTLSRFLRNLSYAVMVVLVMVTALTKIGVPATSLVTVLGAAGLAVGLALKDSLSNIAAGVMLIVLRPMRVGDHVVVAGQEGFVDEIRVLQTQLRALDQRVITLPNSTITTAPIINYTTLPDRRLEISVGVGYEDDLKQAQTILLEIAKQCPLVLKQPEPFVLVTNLGESSVDLMLYCYAKNADFGKAKSLVLEAIRNQLTEKGLSIPYPQRDLHVYHHSADGTPLPEVLAKSVADDGDLSPGTPMASGN